MYGNHQEFIQIYGKFDDQQQYKAILEASMFSTPEELTDKIPLSPDQSEPAKNTSARKLLRKLSDLLDIKPKTAVLRISDSKSKFKAIISGNVLRSIISKRCGHTKSNQHTKEALYNLILHHPQVVKYQIENDCLYVSIDGI